MNLSRQQAWNLLTQYNNEPFHLRHAITVEQVLGWFAQHEGFGEQRALWEQVGLLHDLDYERWPDEHCIKSQQLLAQAGVDEDVIRAITSHGWGHRVDVKPEHHMEKVLYAVDELTGLIGAAALMRPSKSVSDMELSSIKKKFKDKKFAAGCSRDVIIAGAEMLGWDLERLLSLSLQAMQAQEAGIEAAVAAIA
jgi:predicted hydrolase (HD superfamily)